MGWDGKKGWQIVCCHFIASLTLLARGKWSLFDDLTYYTSYTWYFHMEVHQMKEKNGGRKTSIRRYIYIDTFLFHAWHKL
jgi:hypothetical protein